MKMKGSSDWQWGPPAPTAIIPYGERRGRPMRRIQDRKTPQLSPPFHLASLPPLPKYPLLSSLAWLAQAPAPRGGEARGGEAVRTGALARVCHAAPLTPRGRPYRRRRRRHGAASRVAAPRPHPAGALAACAPSRLPSCCCLCSRAQCGYGSRCVSIIPRSDERSSLLLVLLLTRLLLYY